MDVSADDFAALFAAVSTWGRWGETDERGALHHLTPTRVVAAAGLVRDGITISMSCPVDTVAAAHNPRPATHRITRLPDPDADPGSLGFAMDYVGLDYHSDTHTHLDALCHVAFGGSLYNGQPCQRVTSEGAAVGSIQTLRDGLVGRGVLLDVPRLRGVPWLEPGEHVFPDELEAAERAQGVTVGQGDILLIRTGHARRLAELGPWETPGAKAGLHPTAMPLLAGRRIAALGSDGNSDPAPSSTEGVPFPIHVLAINAMGVHLLDYLQLEHLRLACEARGRWSSCSWRRRCGSSGGRVPPSTRSRSYRPGHRIVDPGTESAEPVADPPPGLTGRRAWH
jgi:kynurenine formamidase